MKYFLQNLLALSSVTILLNIQNVIAADFNEYDLKSLFTSPSQRKNIDATRRGEATTGTSLRGPSSISINGVVKRNNGKSVVWVNGKSTLNNTTIDSARVQTKSIKKTSKKIPIYIDGKKVYMRPGQTWSEESGKVADNY